MDQLSKQSQQEKVAGNNGQSSNVSPGRRSFLRTGLIAGGAGVVGAALGVAGTLGVESANNGQQAVAAVKRSGPTKGDIAILRFLSAAEIIETDLWQQYNELGGVPDNEVPRGKVIAPYVKALQVLDGDMSQYIHDNTEDEHSHFTFLNAYLTSKGAEPVNLDKYRTLQGSKATGAQNIGRITNLMQLTVDTTFWTIYRSRTGNPDLGDTFQAAIPGLLQGKFPAIPRDDNDLSSDKHIQAIANTAGFHFAFIEQGGSSLYPSLAQRVSDPEALRILLSIGPTETMHFQTWQDKAGNAPALTDPTNGLVFPDLNASGSEDTQTNLIMPEPTVFLNRKFPAISIIRSTETKGAAMGAIKSLIDDGLFIGQPPEFLKFLQDLATAADAAQREF